MKKHELEIQMPSDLWDGIALSPVLDLEGAERRDQLPQIVVETLRAVAPRMPTSRNLQRLCRIRRKSFLRLLKQLVDCRSVTRVGGGNKGSPYRYHLTRGSH